MVNLQTGSYLVFITWYAALSSPPIKPPWDIQLCMLGRIEQEFDFYRPWLCSCYFCGATCVTEYVVVTYFELTDNNLLALYQVI